MYEDPFADFDWSAERDECDRRLAGLLAQGGELDRAMARAIEQINSQA